MTRIFTYKDAVCAADSRDSALSRLVPDAFAVTQQVFDITDGLLSEGLTVAPLDAIDELKIDTLHTVIDSSCGLAVRHVIGTVVPWDTATVKGLETCVSDLGSFGLVYGDEIAIGRVNDLVSGEKRMERELLEAAEALDNLKRDYEACARGHDVVTKSLRDSEETEAKLRAEIGNLKAALNEALECMKPALPSPQLTVPGQVVPRTGPAERSALAREFGIYVEKLAAQNLSDTGIAKRINKDLGTDRMNGMKVSQIIRELGIERPAA